MGNLKTKGQVSCILTLMVYSPVAIGNHSTLDNLKRS
jgi:hypothetical protein